MSEGWTLGGNARRDGEFSDRIRQITDQAAEAIARRTEILASAVAGTRDLVNTPPVDLFPESFAEQARAAADRSR